MTIVTAWFFLAVWEVPVVVGPFTTPEECRTVAAATDTVTRVAVVQPCWSGPVAVVKGGAR